MTRARMAKFHHHRSSAPITVLGAVLVAATLLTAPARASTAAPADEIPSVISDWNSIALTTLTGDVSKAPQEGFLYVAFVQAAMYDAVVGIKGRYRPYRFDAHAPRHTSATAAAATAAHTILVTYSPYATPALDADLATSLAQVPDGTPKTNGIAFGELAAQNIIDLRANDGRNAPILFTKPSAPGVWRPTPPGFLPMAVPWMGQVTPLLVRDAQQFAPPPPPTLTSTRYTHDFAEVQTYGSATSTVRTPAQSATALFFSGNVLVQMNAAERDQAARRHLNIVDAARMFAAVDMTMCDALITTWQAKLVYGFWRPITAIQLADTDGNPATSPDPTWTPLLTTPNYPDYTSGYNAEIASSSRALEELFGAGRLNLSLISTAVPGATRHYDDADALRTDVVNARIWLGIHFRFADIGARNLGTGLASWTLHHYFQPIAMR